MFFSRGKLAGVHALCVVTKSKNEMSPGRECGLRLLKLRH